MQTEMMDFVIRAASAGDVDAMQRIEIDAGRRFADLGMHSIAEAVPDSDQSLLASVAVGRAWMAIDEDNRPIGYAVSSVVDGEGHLDQVSVMCDAAGFGIGAALVDAVLAWAGSAGFGAVTLTTFADVAFNGPLYERMGFVTVEPSDQGPELRAIRAAEVDAGIDVAPRIAMIRHLTANSS